MLCVGDSVSAVVYSRTNDLPGDKVRSSCSAWLRPPNDAALPHCSLRSSTRGFSLSLAVPALRCVAPGRRCAVSSWLAVTRVWLLHQARRTLDCDSLVVTRLAPSVDVCGCSMPLHAAVHAVVSYVATPYHERVCEAALCRGDIAGVRVCRYLALVLAVVFASELSSLLRFVARLRLLSLGTTLLMAYNCGHTAGNAMRRVLGGNDGRVVPTVATLQHPRVAVVSACLPVVWAAWQCFMPGQADSVAVTEHTVLVVRSACCCSRWLAPAAIALPTPAVLRSSARWR